jgi:hypothetical protein
VALAILRIKDANALSKISEHIKGSKDATLQLKPVGRVENEEKLTSMIYTWPEELLFAPESKARVIVKCREFHGVDLLFITDKGEIYIVEAKRKENETLRHALAQALEYTAAIWSSYRDNVEALIERLDSHKNCEFPKEDGRNARELIESLTPALEENIDKGRFNLVIVADMIPDTLKMVIDFLSRYVPFKIMAVELLIYQDESGSLEVINPKIYTSTISSAYSTSKKATIIEKLSEIQDEELKERMEKLASLAEAHGRLAGGYGETTVFRVLGFDGRTTMVSVFKDGTIAFYLGYRRDSNFKTRKQKEMVIEKLKQLGLLDKDYIIDSHSDQKNLSKKLGDMPEEVYNEFLKIIEDIIS